MSCLQISGFRLSLGLRVDLVGAALVGGALPQQPRALACTFAESLGSCLLRCNHVPALTQYMSRKKRAWNCLVADDPSFPIVASGIRLLCGCVQCEW
ncbi:hypothetical protein [Cupriavidus pauculus]|uniref:Uncharacterized protein n=1 Tax=Cupriavidus pauculus TaxID=82633 RepID=A0A2N5C228_9BURK|nr:hypothetical protein [Cupriavidus pauculus]PLP96265.1 hypothetical protein CYJ10_33080 [Cupriavidus pauculus]